MEVMSILNQTLIITAIGVGLIFFGIICLWIMMELMVRFIHDPREKEEAQADEPEQATAPAAPAASDARRKAAAAAVAIALARSSASLGISAHAGQPVSSWQSVRRAMDRQQNSQLFNRK
jgi:Na+-transporting methylmalonyl-CoA/oxaloacetate decarboxylase gamma subunit